MLGPHLKVQMWFCVAGARDCAPYQKKAKREGFVAFPKTMAGVGHLQRICKDAFRVASAVQETCSSEMLGGQGDDFAWQVQHFVWPGITFSWQARTLDRWSGKIVKRIGTRGCQLCTQLCIFEGGLAELLRFWCCQLRKLRKSRRIVSFLTLSSSKIEDVSQNCFAFDVVRFKNWGSLAE